MCSFALIIQIMSKETEDKAINRIAYLGEQFNILSTDEFNQIIPLLEDSKDDFLVKNDKDDKPLAIISSVLKKSSNYEGFAVSSFKKTVKIHEDVFIDMVSADPTENKIYLQWMLNVFTKFLKENAISDAIRFAAEDLPLANTYLKLFDSNKRKQLFKKLCMANSELLSISDPTNINQYKSLEQVFDVIDPFIERDFSTLEKSMMDFVKLGEAEIPVRDRNFTVYVPLTVDSSVILQSFVNWCTTPPGNGMFKSYTERLQPDGKPSKLYVVIDNRLFTGESDQLWQIHFESSQVRDRKDVMEKDFYDKVLSKSEMISKYFYNELIWKAKSVSEKSSKPTDPNKYLDYLLEFGHPEAMFDILSDNVPALAFSEKIIPIIPNVSRFKNADYLYIDNCKLKELHQSIVTLDGLTAISIPFNKMEVLPHYIGDCRNLVFINLVGNKIKHIPNDISKLDPTNGGKLVQMSVRKEDIGNDNYEKLRKLLPSVKLGSVKIT